MSNADKPALPAILNEKGEVIGKYVKWHDGRHCEIINGRLVGLRDVVDVPYETVEPKQIEELQKSKS